MIALSVSLDRAKPRSLIAAIAAKKDKTYITALIKMPADMDFFEAYGKIKEVFGRLSNMVKSRRVLIEEPASTAAAKIVGALKIELKGTYIIEQIKTKDILGHFGVSSISQLARKFEKLKLYHTDYPEGVEIKQRDYSKLAKAIAMVEMK